LLWRAALVLACGLVATLRADVSYRGFYSGTLSSGGRIGIYVNTNNDVIVIATDPLSGSFGASNNVKVSANGSFSGTYSLAAITGQISANGTITGNAASVGLSFTCRRAPFAGVTRAFEGYYQGWIFDPNNRLLGTTIITSADGQCYMFIQDGPDVVDAGSGTIDARGIFSFRDVANRTSSGSIITTAGGLAWNGRYSKVGVGAYTFVVGRRTAANKLINIATRGKVEPGDGALVAGFVIEGGAKTVLIRGIGPGLTAFGVDGALADPVLTLNQEGTVIATNDNWSDTLASTSLTEVRDTTALVGAFALAANSRDAVLLLRLEPGAYTALLSGLNGGSGLGLVEVYEIQ